MPKRTWTQYAGQELVKSAFGLNFFDSFALEAAQNMPRSYYGVSDIASAADNMVTNSTSYASGSYEQNENPQYVATVRNTKSAYGRKRRRNLRNAWRDIEKSRSTVLSRFQSFPNVGLASAIGTYPLVFEDLTDTVNKEFPCYVFRLTSMPFGKYQPDAATTAIAYQPVVSYRLKSLQTVANGADEYYFSRDIDSYQLNPGGTGKKNVFQEIERTGDTLSLGTQDDGLKSFRHEYSNIKMTLYPQSDLGCTFTVSLCKFKPEFPAWPYSSAFPQSSTTPIDIYKHSDPIVNSQKQAAVTAMWDKYFSGKLKHPHNTMRTPTGTERPFTVLREESFFVPSRDPGDGPSTRVLKKLFFRNDRSYNSLTPRTGIQEGLGIGAGNVVGTYQYYQVPVGELGSPMCRPEDEVWLMVTASGFKPRTGPSPSPANVAYPSFDICIENKHSFLPSDIYEPPVRGTPIIPPTAAEFVEPLLVSTDPTPSPEE